ncbi:MAG TPA: LCP family protein [Nocardioidaceae bacterium]|nr:LCP family protein [Nocardioidaceae bacterium]
MAGPSAPEHAQALASPRGGGRRRGYRRASGLPGTIGVTFLGAVLPGAGFLWTRRVVMGLVVLLATLGLAAWAGWYVARDVDAIAEFAFDPAQLQVAGILLGTALLLWLAVVVSTYLLARPQHRTRRQTVLGAGFVVVLSLAMATPLAVGMRYVWVQADLVETVFEDNRSATAPKQATKEDPWAGKDRVNVLLLGGDGNVRRDGVRTDSVILASIDTETGRTVLFSLPRNMMNAQFPVGSPLRALYPDGFAGYGDEAGWMLNAVYGQVPALHPGVLGESDNEGADAVKHAVGGTLDLDVDYYVLVNLLGFQQLVDAMGGVTVNINQPVPIGGNTDLGTPPEGYLEPGPEQRLNGFEALWFTRGRYGSSDYERMERQRCMIDAIIEEARPLTLLRRYEGLAATGKEIVRTDIPSSLMPAFVDLALRVKQASVRSVVFLPSERFSSADPDFEWMRSVVRQAISPPEPADPSPPSSPSAGVTPSAPSEPPPVLGGQPSPEVGEAAEIDDACVYRPDEAVAFGD